MGENTNEKEVFMQKLYEILPAYQQLDADWNRLAMAKKSVDDEHKYKKSLFSQCVKGIFGTIALLAVLCVLGMGLCYVLIISSFFDLKYANLDPLVTNAKYIALAVIGFSVVVNIIKCMVKSAQSGKRLRSANKIVDEYKTVNFDERHAYLDSISQFLSPRYRNTMAIQYMYEALYYNRARTIQEAYSMYEEQLYRWNMERAAAQPMRRF